MVIERLHVYILMFVYSLLFRCVTQLNYSGIFAAEGMGVVKCAGFFSLLNFLPLTSLTLI